MAFSETVPINVLSQIASPEYMSTNIICWCYQDWHGWTLGEGSAIDTHGSYLL